jgi:cellobiose phosphorylase
LKIENGYLRIQPCIPKDWKEYQIQYKWKESLYQIKVKNPEGKSIYEEGKSKVFLNGNEVTNCIKLDGSRNVYQVEVRI